MVGAVSAVGSYAVSKVWGAHATNRRGPTPLRPVREVTPVIPTKRIITYQLRPDGRLEMHAYRTGSAVDRRV